MTPPGPDWESVLVRYLAAERADLSARMSHSPNRHAILDELTSEAFRERLRLAEEAHRRACDAGACDPSTFTVIEESTERVVVEILAPTSTRLGLSLPRRFLLLHDGLAWRLESSLHPCPSCSPMRGKRGRIDPFRYTPSEASVPLPSGLRTEALSLVRSASDHRYCKHCLGSGLPGWMTEDQVFRWYES